MAGKGVAAQRDEVILVELVGIKQSIIELKTAVGGISEDLGTVRISELTAIRSNLSDLAGELRSKVAQLDAALRERIATIDTNVQVLNYQAKRSGAFAGAWISAVISVLVAAGAALLLRHQ